MKVQKVFTPFWMILWQLLLQQRRAELHIRIRICKMKKKNRMKSLSSADYKKIISGFRNDFLLCYTTRRLLLKDEKNETV